MQHLSRVRVVKEYTVIEADEGRGTGSPIEECALRTLQPRLESIASDAQSSNVVHRGSFVESR